MASPNAAPAVQRAERNAVLGRPAAIVDLAALALDQRVNELCKAW